MTNDDEVFKIAAKAKGEIILRSMGMERAEETAPIPDDIQKYIGSTTAVFWRKNINGAILKCTWSDENGWICVLSTCLTSSFKVDVAIKKVIRKAYRFTKEEHLHVIDVKKWWDGERGNSRVKNKKHTEKGDE